MDNMYDIRDMDAYFDFEKDRYGDYGYNPDLLTEHTAWGSSYEDKDDEYRDF